MFGVGDETHLLYTRVTHEKLVGHKEIRAHVLYMHVHVYNRLPDSF